MKIDVQAEKQCHCCRFSELKIPADTTLCYKRKLPNWSSYIVSVGNRHEIHSNIFVAAICKKYCVGPEGQSLGH